MHNAVELFITDCVPLTFVTKLLLMVKPYPFFFLSLFLSPSFSVPLSLVLLLLFPSALPSPFSHTKMLFLPSSMETNSNYMKLPVELTVSDGKIVKGICT